jgi:hypothetical protein
MVHEISGEEDMGGVELLALYGDEEESLGSFWSRMRNLAKRGIRFTPAYMAAHGMKSGLHRKKPTKKHPKFTPQYFAARGVKKVFAGEDGQAALDEIMGAYEDGRLSGDDMEVLGAFLPGLKKIGKFTSKITTGLARAVGIPQSALDALSHIDPTKRGSVVNTAIDTLQKQGKIGVNVPSSTLKFSWKKAAIVGGATAGGLILITILVRAMRPRKHATV